MKKLATLVVMGILILNGAAAFAATTTGGSASMGPLSPRKSQDKNKIKVAKKVYATTATPTGGTTSSTSTTSAGM